MTTFNNNNIGLSVKHVDFHKDKVGKIANFDDGFVGIQWDGSNKVKRYMFLKTDDNDKAQFQFRFVCKSSDNSKEAIEEKETKPVDTSTEEFFDAVEGEVVDTRISLEDEDEDPAFMVLSSPSSEIEDVENDYNHNEERKNFKCSLEELTEVSELNPEDEKVFSFSRCFTKLPCAHLHSKKVDKHRIILTVDRDILLCGVGLSLKSSPTKVILTLNKSDNIHGEWNKVVTSVVFEADEVTVDSEILQFQHLLSSQESYLLVLSFHGGESYLYGDGKDAITAVIDSLNKVRFSFETYKNDKVTNVNQGVINKFYFRPL